MTLEEFIEGAKDHEDIMDMLKKIMDLTPVLVIIVQGRTGWRPAADKDYGQLLMTHSTVKIITSLKEKHEKETLPASHLLQSGCRRRSRLGGRGHQNLSEHGRASGTLLASLPWNESHVSPKELKSIWSVRMHSKKNCLKFTFYTKQKTKQKNMKKQK